MWSIRSVWLGSSLSFLICFLHLVMGSHILLRFPCLSGCSFSVPHLLLPFPPPTSSYGKPSGLLTYPAPTPRWPHDFSQMPISSLDLPQVSICLSDISTWVANWCLNLHLSSSSTYFPTLVPSNSILPIVWVLIFCFTLDSFFSDTPHAIPQLILLALTSKYIQNLATSHQLCCYHPDLSSHQLSPGILQ